MRNEITLSPEMEAMDYAFPYAAGEELQVGALCSLTKRVMIVSPLPERVRSLLVALSAECFDVFSLHDLDLAMVQSLKPELLVYDAMPVSQAAAGNTLQEGATLIETAALSGLPVLVLLDRQSHSLYGGSLPRGAELLLWPAKPEQALERINDMLDNRPAPAASAEFLIFKDIRIDRKRMIVERAGQRIDLTKTEYDLLIYFLTSDGSVLTRESMLDTVWGLQFYGGSNVIDVHIKTLRKKLKDSAVAPKYIVTVRGAGYRLAD